ncbi:MAG: hypothetical protein M9939_26535 [Mesorhizobium sp.]|nr:hypothetical protein [Mesorhizobium sp.]MCO5164651.1 hypothetical protein [Mesorhizobium sp.]
MALSEKLSRFYPGAEWSLDGDDYSGLMWFGPGDKPTEQDLDALDFEMAKDAKIVAINARLNDVLTGGYTVETGTMAGKVLQTRNLEDRTNWLISQASYSAAVAMGHGAVEGATFRTADNSTFTVTFAEGLSILLAMAAWGAAAMNHSWALKDAAAAAEDQTALDALDIETGW